MGIGNKCIGKNAENRIMASVETNAANRRNCRLERVRKQTGGSSTPAKTMQNHVENLLKIQFWTRKVQN